MYTVLVIYCAFSLLFYIGFVMHINITGFRFLIGAITSPIMFPVVLGRVVQGMKKRLGVTL